MSKFFVGQRVRLVRRPAKPATQNPVPIGTEGRIAAFQALTPGTRVQGGFRLAEYSDCIVDYGPAHGPRSSNTSRLEPIVPNGHRASEHTFHQLMDLLTAGEVANV